jgi:UDP-2,4-diacetamido-2,4,6-trideoxy-beta-L-altropyranose hydrolase
MISGSLLFRADASVAMGTGHVMRCLALAQAWQDAGGSAVFAMAEVTPAVGERLRSESCAVVSISDEAGTHADARQTIAQAREKAAEWVVVDGYQFAEEYQRELKSAGLKVLFLDDSGHAAHYSADLVLNQNVCADESLYTTRESYTRLLLGTRYCLLRREFGARAKCDREISPVGSRLLVTLGGSDPENLTARALQALTRVNTKNLQVSVVVGGSNPHFQALQCAAVKIGNQPGLKIRAHRDISNMAELMAWADGAISAAGSTCWELCRLGLPALLIDAAENQKALARELDRRECAIHVGGAKEVSDEMIANQLEQLFRSFELRKSLSLRCRQLVDGCGTRRIVSLISGGEGVHLRRARTDDGRLLWEWVNDPDVRSASFASGYISWEAHVKWLEDKLLQNGSLILIAEDDEGTPVGQIRFDSLQAGEGLEGDAKVDVSVAKTRRGHGLATTLIKLGMRALLRERNSNRVHAFVKPANVSSVRVFEKANFRQVGTEQVRGNAVIHFVCERN